MKKFVVPLTLALTLVGLVTYKALADADATVTSKALVYRIPSDSATRLLVTSYPGKGVAYQKVDTTTSLTIVDSVIITTKICGEAVFTSAGRLFLGPSKLAAETLTVKDTFTIRPSSSMRGTQIVPFCFEFTESYASDSDTTMPWVWRAWNESPNRSVQLQNVTVTNQFINW